MAARDDPGTVEEQPQQHPTMAAPDGALSRGNTRITSFRLACYLVAAMWLGSVTEANWRDVLAGDWWAFTTSGVIAVAWLAVLAVMWWRDKRRGRFGGET